MASVPSKKIDRKYGVNFYNRPNSPFNKRPYLPGQHGKTVMRRKTVFSRQRKAKQMIKAYYNLDEKQAKAIYLRASKKVGNTTTAILQLLESRVRTAVFRAGFVVSFLAAKQLISHGHFLLNGRTITISSINLRPGDKLELKESSPIRKLLTENVQVIKRADSAHLEVDKEKFVITYKHHPASTDEIPWENPLDIIAFIEYYSR